MRLIDFVPALVTKKLVYPVLAVCLTMTGVSFAQAQRGYYGKLILHPLGDGRKMEVVETFGYVDSKSRTWEVPPRTIVDGASIPGALWSIIGGPWEGKYRDSSVIHDFYCEKGYRAWRDTHDVFYEAMLTSGVERKLAKLMYYAVYRFGPRWAAGHLPCEPGHKCFSDQRLPYIVRIAPVFDPAQFEAARTMIESSDPSQGSIAQMAETEFKAPASTVIASGKFRNRGYKHRGEVNDYILQFIKHDDTSN